MPRPIQPPLGAAGVASYKLGGAEGWTLNSLTASLNAAGIAGTGSLMFDARSPVGGVIYRQLIAITDQSAFVALAFGAEAINNSGTLGDGWPAGVNDGGINVTSESLPPLTLTGNCSLYLYYFQGFYDGTGDPLQNVDPGAIISDLHLWVEDINSTAQTNITVGPFMLVPGSQA